MQSTSLVVPEYVKGKSEMDWLSFFAKIIESTAWPIAVVILLVIFRHPFSKVFLTLTNLKYKDLSIDFKRELGELELATKRVEIERKNKDGADHNEIMPVVKIRNREDEIEQVASISPRAAIPLAWSMVEETLFNTVVRLAISPDYPPHNSALKNMECLREYGDMDNETYEALNRMRILRNETVHGRYNEKSITSMEALEYFGLAQKMVAKLESISWKAHNAANSADAKKRRG